MITVIIFQSLTFYIKTNKNQVKKNKNIKEPFPLKTKLKIQIFIIERLFAKIIYF